MDLGFLSQPLTIQVGLGAGYAAYALAYAGIRRHHNMTDVFFRTVLFSLFSVSVFALFRDVFVSWFLFIAAVLLPLLIAIVWRLLLAPKYQRLLGWLGYYADDSPSAWHSLSHDEIHYFTQVAILTTDEEWLRCDDLAAFENSPSGPAIFGVDGDIAIYVTHRQPKGQDAKAQPTTIDSEFGDRMTFVPKGQIKRVTFRRKRVN